MAWKRTLRDMRRGYMGKSFGKQLKELREKAGLSQGDVSKAFGYNKPQFISNWERELSMPPVQTLKKLAVLYSVDAEALFDTYEKVVLARIHKNLARKFKVSTKRA